MSELSSSQSHAIESQSSTPHTSGLGLRSEHYVSTPTHLPWFFLRSDKRIVEAVKTLIQPLYQPLLNQTASIVRRYINDHRLLRTIQERHAQDRENLIILAQEIPEFRGGEDMQYQGVVGLAQEREYDPAVLEEFLGRVMYRTIADESITVSLDLPATAIGAEYLLNGIDSYLAHALDLSPEQLQTLRRVKRAARVNQNMLERYLKASGKTLPDNVVRQTSWRVNVYDKQEPAEGTLPS